MGPRAPATTPLAELTAVTQEQVAAFVAAAERLLRAAGYRTKREIEAEERQPPRAEDGDLAEVFGGPFDATRRPAPGGGAGEASPFKAVNDEALRRLEAWVPLLFPTAKHQPATGA